MRSNFAQASLTTLSGLIALVLLPCGAAHAQEDPAQLNTVLDIETLYDPVEPLPIHGETAVELLEELQGKHYVSLEINDGFSSQLFDKFLDGLDGSHLYFLKSDVDELSAYRYTLDDALKAGCATPGFQIYKRY